MITTETYTAVDLAQLKRKELAVAAWREGQIPKARLILETVTTGEMSARVSAEILVTEAVLLCAVRDFTGALVSLKRAAPFIDGADLRVQGSFYFHRALAYRNFGDCDAALTDYAGCLAFWEAIGDSNYQIAALNNLAFLYLKKDNLEAANNYIARAFELLTPDSTHVCNVYDTQAKILLEEGRLEKAWQAIEMAIEYADGNEIWKADCLETRDAIQKKAVECVVPIVAEKGLEGLKVEVIRYALEVSDGSVSEAAKLLNVSHQVISYSSLCNGLARKPRRRKSIIKPLS